MKGFIKRIKERGNPSNVYPKISFWRRCRYIFTGYIAHWGWRMGDIKWSDPPGSKDVYIMGVKFGRLDNESLH